MTFTFICSKMVVWGDVLTWLEHRPSQFNDSSGASFLAKQSILGGHHLQMVLQSHAIYLHHLQLDMAGHQDKWPVIRANVVASEALLVWMLGSTGGVQTVHVEDTSAHHLQFKKLSVNQNDTTYQSIQE